MTGYQKNFVGDEARISDIEAGAATVTSADLHLYADGTGGDDANDGLTASTPKKTLAAVAALLPSLIAHNVAIHLQGIFTDAVTFQASVKQGVGNSLTIDGGSSVTIISGPHTADTSSINTIGLSTLSETVDVHGGLWVQILDGPAVGQFRLINSNTATVFAAQENFTVDPGNALFQVVRPATEFTSAGFAITLVMGGGGLVSLQRLYFSGSSRVAVISSSAFIGIQSIVSDASGQFDAIKAENNLRQIALKSSFFIDPDDFSIDSNLMKVGPSQRDSTSGVYLGGCTALQISAGYFRKMRLERCGLELLTTGRCRGQLEMTNVGRSSSASTPVMKTGFTIDSSSGVGLLMTHSHVDMDGTVVIENNTTHGIEAHLNSLVEMTGAVSGAGNGSSGMHIDGKSICTIANGSAPTLTGNSGTVEVSLDGTTQESTWAAIDAGTAIDGATVGNDEFVLVKEA